MAAATAHAMIEVDRSFMLFSHVRQSVETVTIQTGLATD
jgi:hypothetical protein